MYFVIMVPRLLLFVLCGTITLPQSCSFEDTAISRRIHHLSCDVPEITILLHVAYQFVDSISSVATAVEETNEIYNGRFRLDMVSISNRSKFFCEQLQDETANVAASFYYKKKRCPGTTIFLSPYCTPDFILMARMTSEWNVPIFSILGSFPSEATTYRTAVTAAPTHNAVFAAFLKKFLLSNGWTTIFLLCDDMRDIGYYRANCENFKQQLIPSIFKLSFTNFDSGTGKVDYDDHLESVREAARIVFLLCRSEVARTLLIRAQAANMTGDEYVYLFAQPYTMPPSFPDLSWLHDSSEISSRTRGAVLYVTYDNEGIADKMLTNTVQNIRKKIADAKPTDSSSTTMLAAITVFAYLTTTLIAKVINETVTSDNYTASVEALQDGAGIARTFFNRTFSLPTGTIYFSPTGQRHVDMLVKQYNQTSGKFESVVQYVHKTGYITLPFGRKLVWNGRSLPLAEPACGFDNEKCLSRGLLSTVVPAGVAIGMIVGGSILVAWWLYRRSRSDERRWWLLEHSDFLTLDKRKSVFSAKLPSVHSKQLHFI